MMSAHARLALALAGLVAPALILTAGLDAHAAARPTPVPPAHKAPPVARVAIAGYAFRPKTLTVVPGTRVTWTNTDSDSHAVASDSHAVASDSHAVASDSHAVASDSHAVASDSHAVASDTGAFMESANLSTGQSFTHTFGKAGVYRYHCGLHAFMTGTVIVKTPTHAKP